jgi:hypothetical protein
MLYPAFPQSKTNPDQKTYCLGRKKSVYIVNMYIKKIVYILRKTGQRFTYKAYCISHT